MRLGVDYLPSMCQVLGLTPNTIQTKRKMLTTSQKSSSSHRAISWIVGARAVPWRPSWLVWTGCSSRCYLASSISPWTLMPNALSTLRWGLGQVLPGFYYPSFKGLKWLANNLTLWYSTRSFQKSELITWPIQYLTQPWSLTSFCLLQEDTVHWASPSSWVKVRVGVRVRVRTLRVLISELKCYREVPTG